MPRPASWFVEALIPAAAALAITLITVALHPGMSSAATSDTVFQHYTKGVIENPAHIFSVNKALECAFLCKNQLVCSAFSIKQDLTSQLLECSISLGEFQWVPDAAGQLFGENIGGVKGYNLGRDGYLYKVFNYPKLTAIQSKSTCVENEQGDVAVPYPAKKYQAVFWTPGFQNSTDSFFLGATRTGGATDVRWITDDGDVFNSNNQTLDTDQKWMNGEPATGDDFIILGHSNGTWEARDGSSPRDFICRRSIARYIKSPVKDVYYRASTGKVSQMAAQAECQKDGGTLATVVTMMDLNATEHFRSRQRGYSTGFFIAGDDNAQEGTWVYPDGTIIDLSDRMTDPFQTLFWDPRGPSINTSENCLIMTFTGVTSATCGGPRRFICQITPG